jgi:hypothetical protein
MQTTQHSNTRCPVYLHPAACTNPAVVEAIQKHTGLLVIVTPPGTRLAPSKANVVAHKPEPFGGDAA